MLDLPLEYALIEFENASFSGKIVPEILDLAERGIVRVVDIAFIQKEEDGSIPRLNLMISTRKCTSCSFPSASTFPACLRPTI